MIGMNPSKELNVSTSNTQFVQLRVYANNKFSFRLIPEVTELCTWWYFTDYVFFQHAVCYPRPIVILGVCDSEVREALLNEASAFSLPPTCKYIFRYR